MKEKSERKERRIHSMSEYVEEFFPKRKEKDLTEGDRQERVAKELTEKSLEPLRAKLESSRSR